MTYANGCGGAGDEAYAKWLKDKKPKLTDETTYPYKNNETAQTTYTCPTSYKEFNQAEWSSRGPGFSCLNTQAVSSHSFLFAVTLWH